MIGLIYGYIRVSTKAQIQGNSLEEQRANILNRYPDAIIFEESKSGATKRPVFENVIAKAGAGDVIVITKLDRFCRTVKEGLEYIDELMNKGCNIHILNMGLIEDTPMGRLIVTNLLAFAEFERAMIIERTQSGREIARQNPNYREGRPKKYSPEKMQHALDLLKTHSYAQVERLTGISKSTLVRGKKLDCKNKI